MTIKTRKLSAMTLRQTIEDGIYHELEKGCRVYHARTGATGQFLCYVSGLEDWRGWVRLDEPFNKLEGWHYFHAATTVPFSDKDYAGERRVVKIEISALEEIVK